MSTPLTPGNPDCIRAHTGSKLSRELSPFHCSVATLGAKSMQAQSLLTSQQIKEFISHERLPDRFREIIDAHYSPLATWLVQQRSPGETLFVGINGAQGTGKSTLAAFLKLALESGIDWRVAVLSIDDFYLSRAERERLGKSVHPLLETRGAPGTHDMTMLAACVGQLKNLDAAATLSLPRFDKALDNRADTDTWPVVSGPVDLIILEGWCVGSMPQSSDALMQAINLLEQNQDASGTWRRYVNEQLKGSYAALFAQLDKLIFLQAPNFDVVQQWRLEQEEKLAGSTAQSAARIMSGEQIAHFISHFERLTTANLTVLPELADVVLEFNKNHACMRSRYSTRLQPGRRCDRGPQV